MTFISMWNTKGNILKNISILFFVHTIKVNMVPFFFGPNQFNISFFFMRNTKADILEKVSVFFFLCVCVHTMKILKFPCFGPHWLWLYRRKTALYFLFFVLFLCVCVPQKKENVIQVCNNMRLSKCWWIFICGWTTPLSTELV